MTEIALSALLAVATCGLVFVTYQLVVVNKGQLNATKKAAEAATESAKAATVAAAAASKNAEVAEREFFLAHRSYVRAANFKATTMGDRAVRLEFDVVDVAGVPTHVTTVHTRSWLGDLKDRPSTAMQAHHINSDVYRSYSHHVTDDLALHGRKLTDGVWIRMEIGIDYHESASGKTERWIGGVWYYHSNGDFSTRVVNAKRDAPAH